MRRREGSQGGVWSEFVVILVSEYGCGRSYESWDFDCEEKKLTRRGARLGGWLVRLLFWKHLKLFLVQIVLRSNKQTF